MSKPTTSPVPDDLPEDYTETKEYQRYADAYVAEKGDLRGCKTSYMYKWRQRAKALESDNPPENIVLGTIQATIPTAPRAEDFMKPDVPTALNPKVDAFAVISTDQGHVIRRYHMIEDRCQSYEDSRPMAKNFALSTSRMQMIKHTMGKD